MKNFIYSVMLLVIGVVAMTSCGRSVPNTPEGVAEAAANAFYHLDYETLRNLTDPNDEGIINTLNRWEKEGEDAKDLFVIKEDVIYKAENVNDYTADGVMKSVSLTAKDNRHMSIIVKNANGKWYYWGK